MDHVRPIREAFISKSFYIFLLFVIPTGKCSIFIVCFHLVIGIHYSAAPADYEVILYIAYVANDGSENLSFQGLLQALDFTCAECNVIEAMMALLWLISIRFIHEVKRT